MSFRLQGLLNFGEVILCLLPSLSLPEIPY
jgi:hypothetical protein